ncbi:T9SS type A sorting domain-containing protein [Winogradskyella schleiferi]|uniref:T9SS type A sorting domain-containing protein n=1 Tax=Winogradskyella schleiferi TaxID=2686078 RepID=UPI0015BE775F|nr:T9SS type A sorting domain-containing protein [Winogradskyella schleiferi]
MKNLLLIIGLIFFTSLGFSQNYYMPTPEGYGESTTGGGNVTPVTVSTYADFKAKIKLSTPQVILVSGTITIAAGQNISEVVTNKTIIGLPNARLVNNTQTQSGSGILNLKNGSNNVIIRNLIFEGPGAYDVDGRDNLTADGCINLWVDHCEFQDGVDGNFDIKGNSDNVTVSWCKFTYLKPAVPDGPGGSNDHRFSNLIGSSDSQAPADGHYSVTFQNCYWAQGCKERMPRARNGQLHILNCYYNTDVSSSRALGFSGGINTLSCYVENSDFANVGTVYQSYGGTVSLEFDNCINGVSNIGSVPQPTYSYSVTPVEDVAAHVSDANCGAGATLDVTTSGEISSSCEGLGVKDSFLAQIRYYPTLVDDILNIEFSAQNYADVEFSLYSVNGQKLSSKTIWANWSGITTIDLSKYSKGIYFIKLQIENNFKIFGLAKS